MYWILGFINIVIFAIYFHKDPVAATAIFIGVLVALTISGLISLVEHIITQKKGTQND